jgi:hypothetical protein
LLRIVRLLLTATGTAIWPLLRLARDEVCAGSAGWLLCSPVRPRQTKPAAATTPVTALVFAASLAVGRDSSEIDAFDCNFSKLMPGWRLTPEVLEAPAAAPTSPTLTPFCGAMYALIA